MSCICWPRVFGWARFRRSRWVSLLWSIPLGVLVRGRFFSSPLLFDRDRCASCGLSFGGNHTSGIQMVLCDGSVRSASYSVNANVWLIFCQANGTGGIIDWSSF